MADSELQEQEFLASIRSIQLSFLTKYNAKAKALGRCLDLGLMLQAETNKTWTMFSAFHVLSH